MTLLGSITIQARGDDLFTQRELYAQARAAISSGQTSRFNKLAKQLDDYALRPYLDYYRLRARVGTVSAKQVLDFYEDHEDLPAAGVLYGRWLKELGKRRQWPELRNHYVETGDVATRCYYLRALYADDQKDAAFDGAAELWVQPKSQPKECDPLFDVWLKSDKFTEDLAWQRLYASIMANERTLARYLTRFLSGANKAAGEALYRVHVAPSSITAASRHRTDSDRMRTVVEHGLTRLAAREPDKAARAWREFRKRGHFDELATQRIDEVIAVGLAEEGDFPGRRARDAITSPGAIEDLATAAVKHLDWDEIVVWAQRLPPDVLAKSQWQYWLARALLEDESDSERAAAMLAALARQRHYYGFLAARHLGLPGEMNSARLPLDSVDLARLRQNPHIQRAVELFAVNDGINARREWYRALEGFDTDAQVIAAELAASYGMTSLAIRTANIADARDHLHLRFPIVHEPQFRRASLRTNLPVSLLIAIARQESALQDDARSHANARGLMQMLPSTAQMVARRARMPSPSATDLYDPGTNIALASYHLAWLIQRYQGQTPLAIAAYNAGEHRVDRWIKEADKLPMEVWIERIPFRETRNYVKNVLAFRHVYAHKLNSHIPLLGPSEHTVRVQ